MYEGATDWQKRRLNVAMRCQTEKKSRRQQNPQKRGAKGGGDKCRR